MSDEQAPARPADLDEWITACNEAQLRLSIGADTHVHPQRETWETAIARVAAALIRNHGLGRPPGPLPDEWVEVVFRVAARRPASSDGLIAGPRGMRLSVNSLHRSSRGENLSN